MGTHEAMSTHVHTHTSDTVAAEIRALMGRYRVTQHQLADTIGVSQGTVSRRLRAEQPFTVDELDRVAAVFDIPVCELFSERRQT